MPEIACEPPTEEQPRFYYNLSSGQLLVGAAAVDANIETGAHPADIYSLQDVLRDESLALGSSDAFPPLRTRDWQHEEFVTAGKWLASLPHGDKEADLNRDMLVQAARLGISPGIRQVINRSRGKLSNYYDAVGLSNVRRRGSYADWDNSDYIDYMRSAIQEGRKFPERRRFALEMIHSKSKEGLGPSRQQIRDKFGTVKHLVDLAGETVDIAHWTDDDYIDWGIKFMRANGRSPVYSHGVCELDKLASDRLGPSRRQVAKVFGGFGNFVARLEHSYALDLEQRNTERLRKLDDIATRADDPVVARVLELAEGEDKMIVLDSRLQVARELFPNLAPKELQDIAARKTTKGFVSALILACPSLTEGQIEETAILLGVFDDIWPMDDYMQTLKLG